MREGIFNEPYVANLLRLSGELSEDLANRMVSGRMGESEAAEWTCIL